MLLLLLISTFQCYIRLRTNNDPISVSIETMLRTLHKIEKDWNLVSSEISSLISQYQLCLDQHNENIPVITILEKQTSFLGLFNRLITSKQLRHIEGINIHQIGGKQNSSEAVLKQLATLYTNRPGKEAYDILNLVYWTKFENCNKEFNTTFAKKIQPMLKLLKKEVRKFSSAKLMEHSKKTENKLLKAVSTDLKQKLSTLVFTNKNKELSKTIHGSTPVANKENTGKGGKRRVRRNSVNVADRMDEYLSSEDDSGYSDSKFDE